MQIGAAEESRRASWRKVGAFQDKTERQGAARQAERKRETIPGRGNPICRLEGERADVYKERNEVQPA